MPIVSIGLWAIKKHPVTSAYVSVAVSLPYAFFFSWGSNHKHIIHAGNLVFPQFDQIYVKTRYSHQFHKRNGTFTFVFKVPYIALPTIGATITSPHTPLAPSSPYNAYTRNATPNKHTAIANYDNPNITNSYKGLGCNRGRDGIGGV